MFPDITEKYPLLLAWLLKAVSLTSLPWIFETSVLKMDTLNRIFYSENSGNLIYFEYLLRAHTYPAIQHIAAKSRPWGDHGRATRGRGDTRILLCPRKRHTAWCALAIRELAWTSAIMRLLWGKCLFSSLFAPIWASPHPQSMLSCVQWVFSSLQSLLRGREKLSSNENARLF